MARSAEFSSGSGTDPCPSCSGRGWSMVSHDLEDHDDVRQACDDCSGKGRVPHMSPQDLAASTASYHEGRHQRYLTHLASGKHESVCGGGSYCRWRA